MEIEDKQKQNISFIDKVRNSFIDSQEKSTNLAAIFNVINSTIGLILLTIIITSQKGCGVLSLPYMFGLLGVFLGILILIIMLLFSNFTAYLLLKVSKITKLDNYNQICIVCFGNIVIIELCKIGDIILKILLIICLLGGCVAFIVIFGQSIEQIFAIYSSIDLNKFYFQRYLYQIIGALLILPFVLAKSTEKLKIASFIGVGALLFFIFIVFYGFGKKVHYKQISQNEIDTFPKHFDITAVMYSFPSIFLAYNFHYILFPIFIQLKNKTHSNMYKNICIGQAFNGLIYILMGIIGYLSYGDSIKTDNGNYLLSLTPQNLNVVLYYLVMIAFMIHCVEGFPLQFFEARNQLIQLIDKINQYIKTTSQKGKNQNINSSINNNHKENEQLLSQDQNITTTCKKIEENTKYYIITSLIIFVATVTAGIVFQNLVKVFGIIGAIGSNSIGFLFPCSFYLKLEWKQLSLTKSSLSILILIIGLIAAICSIIGNILK